MKMLWRGFVAAAALSMTSGAAASNGVAVGPGIGIPEPADWALILGGER